MQSCMAIFDCVVRMRILGNESAILDTAPIEMVVERPYDKHDGEMLFLSSIRRFWMHFKYTKVSLLFNSLILAALSFGCGSCTQTRVGTVQVLCSEVAPLQL